MKVVCVQDRTHVTKAVAGNRCDLGLGASGERQARYRGPAKIIEGDTNDAGCAAPLAPRGAKAVRRPRFSVGGRENYRTMFRLRHFIERRLQGGADWNGHPGTRF